MRKIHPKHLAGKIKDYGFAAALEVTIVTSYDHFVGTRSGSKLYQASKEKEYVDECIRKYNLDRDDKIDDFEVATGLGILTPRKPNFRIRPLDFAITLLGMNSYVFTLAYEKMMEDADREIRDFAEFARDSKKINAFELMQNSREERNKVFHLMPGLCEKVISKTRGDLAEHYFSLFLKDYFNPKDSLVLHSLEYKFQRWDSKKRRFFLEESEMDFLIACERETFYEKLREMDRNRFCIVDINPSGSGSVQHHPH